MIEEAAPLAQSLEGTIPSIGVFSLSKRLNAYLVVTGHITRLIDDGDVSADVANVAHSLLLDRSSQFRKCYQAFLAAGKSGKLGIGMLNGFAAAHVPPQF